MSDKSQIKRVKLDEIKDPSFLKTLSKKELELLCADIREEIIESTSIYGGHLASNLGVVEITVALHRTFSFPKDKLLIDVGHQSYTHKILTGRSIRHMGEKGATSSFVDSSESPYDQFEAGHSSTSLSSAFAFATYRDLHHENYDVVALIGDSSMSNGLAFEGLNQIGSGNHKVIIVLNDNDMSISKSAGSMRNLFRHISTGKIYNKTKSKYQRMLEKTKTGQALYRASKTVKNWIKRRLVPSNIFDNFGLSYVGPVDGHDVKAIEKALNRAKNSSKSVIVHCLTIKGKGYVHAEKDECGYWHGVTPFDKATGEPLKEHPGKNSWSHIFGDLTCEMMEKHDNAYLICPAMVKGSHMEKAFEAFPKRSHDPGISEEHSLTFAGALALNGLHPIVSVYSTFLQRAYDELSHDVARTGKDVTLLIDRAGLAGKQGATHMGIYDEGYLKSIPNLTLSMPSTLEIAKGLYEDSFVKGRGLYAIRYSHELMDYDENILEKKIEYLSYEAIQVGEKGSKAIVAVGTKGRELMKTMQEKGFDDTLVDPIFLYPISDKLISLLSTSSEVDIYDPYGTSEGFASSLVSALSLNGYQGKFKVKALPHEFISHALIEEQEKDAGLDIDSVIAFFQE